jgi:hypothetical protein
VALRPDEDLTPGDDLQSLGAEPLPPLDACADEIDFLLGHDGLLESGLFLLLSDKNFELSEKLR